MVMVNLWWYDKYDIGRFLVCNYKMPNCQSTGQEHQTLPITTGRLRPVTISAFIDNLCVSLLDLIESIKFYKSQSERSLRTNLSDLPDCLISLKYNFLGVLVTKYFVLLKSVH